MVYYHNAPMHEPWLDNGMLAMVWYLRGIWIFYYGKTTAYWQDTYDILKLFIPTTRANV